MNEYGFKSTAHNLKRPKDGIHTGRAVLTGYGPGIVVDRNAADLTVLISKYPDGRREGLLYNVKADTAVPLENKLSEKLIAEATALILDNALQANIDYEWERNKYLVVELHDYYKLGKPTFETVTTRWAYNTYACYTSDAFNFKADIKKPSLPIGDIMLSIVGSSNGYITEFKPNSVVTNRPFRKRDYFRITD